MRMGRAGMAVLAGLGIAVALARAQDVVEAGGARIAVSLEQGEDPPRAMVLAHVKRCADAVSAYFGRFPIERLPLRIDRTGRPGVHGGKTNGWPRPHVRICVGPGTTQDMLDRDWVLTHEMTHLSFPNVEPSRETWAEEGLATYVEPLARLRVGWYTRERLWRDLVRDLPQGLPQAGEGGLDQTATWGRTYWGGCLFWFLADVRIRQETRLARGLEDALRGILVKGGSVAVDWPLESTLAAGDAAVGVKVLVPLRHEMGPQPVTPDLAALWKQLGVKMEAGVVSFDDGAPLAGVRRAIERGR